MVLVFQNLYRSCYTVSLFVICQQIRYLFSEIFEDITLEEKERYGFIVIIVTVILLYYQILVQKYYIFILPEILTNSV